MATKKELQSQIDELRAEIQQLKAQILSLEARPVYPYYSPVPSLPERPSIPAGPWCTDATEYQQFGDGAQLTSGPVPRWERVVSAEVGERATEGR